MNLRTKKAEPYVKVEWLWSNDKRPVSFPYNFVNMSPKCFPKSSQRLSKVSVSCKDRSLEISN